MSNKSYVHVSLDGNMTECETSPFECQDTGPEWHTRAPVRMVERQAELLRLEESEESMSKDELDELYSTRIHALSSLATTAMRCAGQVAFGGGSPDVYDDVSKKASAASSTLDVTADFLESANLAFKAVADASDAEAVIHAQIYLDRGGHEEELAEAEAAFDLSIEGLRSSLALSAALFERRARNENISDAIDRFNYAIAELTVDSMLARRISVRDNVLISVGTTISNDEVLLLDELVSRAQIATALAGDYNLDLLEAERQFYA